MSKPFAVDLSPKFVLVVVTLCVLFSGCSVTEKTVAAEKGRDMKALTGFRSMQTALQTRSEPSINS